MVVGENGVLNRATNAAEETSKAEVESALKMAVSGAMGDFIGIWNKNNTLDFINCIEVGEAVTDAKTKVLLKAEGYTIDLGTATKDTGEKITGYTGGTIKANSGSTTTYTFNLVRKSQYSVDVTGFAKQ